MGHETTRVRATLSQQNGEQVLRIPESCRLDAEEVVVSRDSGSGRLTVEPVQTQGLLEALAEMDDLDEPFPDVDEDMPPVVETDLL